MFNSLHHLSLFLKSKFIEFSLYFTFYVENRKNEKYISLCKWIYLDVQSTMWEYQIQIQKLTLSLTLSPGLHRSNWHEQ